MAKSRKIPPNVVSIVNGDVRYNECRHIIIDEHYLKDCEYVKVVELKDSIRLEKQYMLVHRKAYKVTPRNGKVTLNVQIAPKIGRYFIDVEKSNPDVVVINLKSPYNG